MPSNDMTPQQRAVRVVKMLQEKPCKATELAKAAHMSRRGLYNLLDTISGIDGMAITNAGGYWYLMDTEESARLRALYANLSAAVEQTPDGHLIVSGWSPRRADVVMLLRFLRRLIIPPID